MTIRDLIYLLEEFTNRDIEIKVEVPGTSDTVPSRENLAPDIMFDQALNEAVIKLE